MTANHDVDDRKIPEATPLLAPWSSLPHHAFSPAPPGFQYQPHGFFFFCIVFHSVMFVCVPSLWYIYQFLFRYWCCMPQSTNAYLSTTLVIETLSQMLIKSPANPLKVFCQNISYQMMQVIISQTVLCPARVLTMLKKKSILITIVGTPIWAAEDMNMNKTEWQQVEGVIFLQIYPNFNIWSIYEWKNIS